MTSYVTMDVGLDFMENETTLDMNVKRLLML